MDFFSKSSDTFIRSFVREENNFYRYDRRPSSSLSLSSHESGSAGGGKVKPSFTSRSSKVSRVMTVPMFSLNRNRRVASKENQTTATAARPRDLDLLRHRASTPVIRNARASSYLSSKRTSNRNEEWNCSANIQMPRDSSTAIFLRDLKRSKPSLKHAISSARQVERKWNANSLKEAVTGNCASLPSNCTASQSIPERPRAISSCVSPSNNNEELLDSRITTEPKSSSLKRCIKQTGGKKKTHHVAFAATPGLIGTSPSKDIDIDIDTIWYTASDHDQFLNDATDRASLIDRMMSYAAQNGEPTYNSSTGLTAPRVLNDYLTSPEEVIGVEHLLTVQKTARENLRCHQTKALLREQQRQKWEGYDPHLLAKRLMSTSAISSHMAQERASYINRMD